MSGRVVSAHTFQSGKKKKKENDGANLLLVDLAGGFPLDENTSETGEVTKFS